ncbi:MAG: c-type cytochrome biogenesis protein CcsB [Candidatus Melainabacteria bacterium]
MHEMNWVHTGVVLLIISTVFYAIRLFKPGRSWHAGGWGSMLLSLLCLGISLYLRSREAEYFALSNMYESLLVVTMSIQTAFLILDRWFARRGLGLPVALMILIALLFDLSLPTGITPLQPALQSYWRSIHVPIILMSYALFTLAFLSSLVFLIKDAMNPGSRGNGRQGGLQLQAGGGGNLQALMQQESADVYDEITYRCVAFGIPLLAVGIILGGIWANEAWGNYWSWDPKESMSLVTLLVYGAYLHLRINGLHGRHNPRMLAWVSVGGFIMMLITYFGVNLMGLGLHSYGKIG